MAREGQRQRLARVLAPRLLPDEEIVGNGAAWFAPVRGTRLLFVGRHYQLVALTDQRLLVFRRRGGHRRDSPLFDSPLDSLRVTSAGGVRILFPVHVTTTDGATVVLEFRPRQRTFGRAVVAAVRQAAVAPAPPL